LSSGPLGVLEASEVALALARFRDEEPSKGVLGGVGLGRPDIVKRSVRMVARVFVERHKGLSE
jgi:hypothetical protein